jgi:hypothetical protein
LPSSARTLQSCKARSGTHRNVLIFLICFD